MRTILRMLLVAKVVVVTSMLGATPGNDSPAVAPAHEASTNQSGPQSLRQQARIVVETKVPTATTGADETVAAERSFRWKFQWEGWNGLNMAIAQKTPIPDPAAELRAKLQGTNEYRVFHLEELKLGGKIGAKLALDGAGYLTSDDLDDFGAGVEIRRARIYAKGDCLLILPVSYQLELGIIPGEFYIEESYLAFRDIAYIGEIKLGQYQAPMGLDVISSSRDITLMEPAAPLQALAPGVNAGVQLGRPVFDGRATWAFGMFTDGVGQDFGDASRDYGRAMIRFTGLPIVRQPPLSSDTPDSNNYLHVGLGANVLYSANSTVRYQARPESHLAPHVVDTGDISSRSALVLSTEVAWVNGPFSIQGEILQSFVEPATNQRLSFGGWYASASWFLTGESRPYNRADGSFGRVIPKHNFNWGRGGWGAWEIAGRYSNVDLSDGDVDGGRLRMLMAGLNWYLHSHVKMRFNYGFGRLSTRESEDNLNVFQMRGEIDF